MILCHAGVHFSLNQNQVLLKLRSSFPMSHTLPRSKNQRQALQIELSLLLNRGA